MSHRLSPLRIFRNIHTSPGGLLKQSKGQSSKQWIERQEKDRFVKSAKIQNYRARSAFKLLEIDDKYKILKPGFAVIDVGAAPGSWTQVAVDRVNAIPTDVSKPEGMVIAVDILRIPPIIGANILDHSDFSHNDVRERIITLLGGRKVDAVLSDMAPNASGVRLLDHEKITSLFESAWKFSGEVLTENGNFLGKLWDGQHVRRLIGELQPFFRFLKVIKPRASRQESAELYIFGRGFKRHLQQAPEG